MLLPRRRASAVEVIWPPRPWAVSGGTMPFPRRRACAVAPDLAEAHREGRCHMATWLAVCGGTMPSLRRWASAVAPCPYLA